MPGFSSGRYTSMAGTDRVTPAVANDNRVWWDESNAQLAELSGKALVGIVQRLRACRSISAQEAAEIIHSVCGQATGALDPASPATLLMKCIAHRLESGGDR